MVIATGVLATASSSIAGIIGAAAGGITALTVLITAITVLIPQIRGIRKVQNAQTTTLGKQTEQLGIIHALSNSTLSIALGAELEATRREKAVMMEVIGLRERAGLQISPETRAALARSDTRIGELSLQLRERQKQAQDIIDAGGDFTPPDTSTATAPSGPA